MTREEIIKSLQHAVDYMNEHESNRITETTFRGEIIDTVIHKNTLIDAIKLLEENKTCRWIPPENEMAQKYGKAYSFRCSECGKTVSMECFINISEFDYKFCPYCGAEMEAEE